MDTLTLRLEDMKTATLRLEDIDVDRDLERQRNIKPRATGGFEAIKESIKNVGINEPIVVYPDGNSYKLCDGYNRLRAIKELKIAAELPPNLDVNKLDCVIVPKEMKNVVRYTTDIRQDLPPSLKAQYIRKLVEDYKMNREDIAHMCGYTLSTIRNWLNVSRLINQIQELMDKEKLPVDCAVSISALNEEGQKKLLNTIKNWDVIRRNEVRDLVTSFSNKYFHKSKSERQQLGNKMRHPDSQRKFLSKSLSGLNAESNYLENEIFIIRRKNRTLVAWIQRILRNDDVREFISERHPDVLEDFNSIIQVETGRI